MHTKPMSEPEGVFNGEEDTFGYCPNCKQKRKITMETWASFCELRVDYKMHCLECGHYWWVVGIDS